MAIKAEILQQRILTGLQQLGFGEAIGKWITETTVHKTPVEMARLELNLENTAIGSVAKRLITSWISVLHIMEWDMAHPFTQIKTLTFFVEYTNFTDGDVVSSYKVFINSNDDDEFSYVSIEVNDEEDIFSDVVIPRKPLSVNEYVNLAKTALGSLRLLHDNVLTWWLLSKDVTPTPALSLYFKLSPADLSAVKELIGPQEVIDENGVLLTIILTSSV